MNKCLLAILLIGFTGFVWAQNDNADVVVEDVLNNNPGCIGVAYFTDTPYYLSWELIADCREHRVTHDDGGVSECHIQGRLPEGAVLPPKGAWITTVDELGFGTCCGLPAGLGVYILTPSGRFSYNCTD